MRRGGGRGASPSPPPLPPPIPAKEEQAQQREDHQDDQQKTHDREVPRRCRFGMDGVIYSRTRPERVSPTRGGTTCRLTARSGVSPPSGLFCWTGDQQARHYRQPQAGSTERAGQTGFEPGASGAQPARHHDRGGFCFELEDRTESIGRWPICCPGSRPRLLHGRRGRPIPPEGRQNPATRSAWRARSTSVPHGSTRHVRVPSDAR